MHKCVFLALVKNIGDARAAPCNLLPLKVVLALNLYLWELFYDWASHKGVVWVLTTFLRETSLIHCFMNFNLLQFVFNSPFTFSENVLAQIKYSADFVVYLLFRTLLTKHLSWMVHYISGWPNKYPIIIADMCVCLLFLFCLIKIQ